MIKLFTIGFTKKTAERFFSMLQQAGVKTILDTRLHNEGQLAGFAKKEDLRFFSERLLQAGYVHWHDSAPSEELLRAYRTKQIKWPEYEVAYRRLLEARHIEAHPVAGQLENACLLCSEDKPHKCHRRILAEYLTAKLPGDIHVVHLT